MEGKTLSFISLASLLSLLAITPAEAQQATPTGLASLPAATNVHDSDTIAVCQNGAPSCTLNTYIWSNMNIGQIANYIAQRTQTLTNQTIAASANTLIGIVTSAGLAVPPGFTVSNSPITSIGTITIGLSGETANTVWAAPSGTTGVPSFRLLVPADIPAISLATTGNGGVFGNLSVNNLNGGTNANSGTYWAGNGVWSTPPGGGGGGGTGSVSIITTTPNTFSVVPFGQATSFTLNTINTILNCTASGTNTCPGWAIGSGYNGDLIYISDNAYTLSQAGSAGFTTGWGVCLVNTALTGAATVAASGGSLFEGAGNTSLLTIPASGWACPTSDGANYSTPANILLAAQNAWQVQQSSPACSFSGLTTITPNASACTIWTINLVSGSNTLINFPTNLINQSNQTNSKLFRIYPPSSGGLAGVTFATGGVGYYFPAAGAEPITSPVTGTNIFDEISCQVYGGTVVASGLALACSNNGLTTFQPVGLPAITYAASAFGVCVSVCSASVAVTGSLQNDMLIVGTTACNNGGCTPQAGVGPTSLTISSSGVCSSFNNAFDNGASGGVQVFLGYCSNIASGSATVLAQWASGAINYQSIFVARIHPPTWMLETDGNLGNTNAAFASASIASITTSGATTLNGQLVFSLTNTANFSAAVSGTLLLSGNNGYFMYTSSPVVQPQTTALTLSPTGHFDNVIAAVR